jgi:hypothetical protein
MTAAAADDLSAQIAKISLSSTSATKFRDLGVSIAPLVGLEPKQVWITYVSKPGNVDVRFTQPGARKTDNEFGLALINRDHDRQAYLGPLKRYVRPQGQFAAIGLCEQDSSGVWHLTAVVEATRASFHEILIGQFPNVEHIVAVTSPGAAVRGPAGSLTTVPLELTTRVRRMIRLAIASAPAVMLVGPPGTGKTTALTEVLKEIDADPATYGFSRAWSARWVTPEESWTTRELVGGETVAEGAELRFRPGYVLEAIRDNQWLVLDEANRADMDRIFGGLLTWLAGHDVQLGRTSTHMDAPAVQLGWSDTVECMIENEGALTKDDKSTDPVRFLAGREWRMLGTYNAVDAQRVFRFGQALGRRFVRVPIPAMSVEEFAPVIRGQTHDLPDDVAKRVIGLYRAHYDAVGTRIGPALFFWIPEYVRRGLMLRVERAEGDDEGGQSDDVKAAEEVGTETQETIGSDASEAGHSEKDVSQFVAEAYLASAGALLRNLEDAELAALESRIVESGALPSAELAWLRELLPSLG